MKESIDLDIASLGVYLEQQIPGFRGLSEAKKFPGGQSNPTYQLRAESGRYVLRRKPPGQLLKSAHAVDREYRVMHALADTDVPVPKALHLCEDDGVIGSMFFVMGFVDGRILWDATLPESTPAERGAMYDEMNRVLAALHSVDIEAAGLADYGRPGNYFERQVGRWTRQYRAGETEPDPAMDRLIEWLPAHTPPDDGRIALIHGDYRLDNLVFAKDRAEILAVLDWELSTLGHPFADLAYQCMQWRLAPDAPIAGLGDIDRAALGIPTEREYVARYCERMGLDGIDHWQYYLVFSFFRLAAILQGVLKRARDGNASSDRAFEVGALSGPLAEMAVELIENPAAI